MSKTHEMHEPNVFKGALAGAVGGLAASWTMNEFQKVLAVAEKQITGGKQGQGSENGSEDAEDATMKTADRISEALQGRHLTNDERTCRTKLWHDTSA
jgi:hypothetical protein